LPDEKGRAFPTLAFTSSGHVTISPASSPTPSKKTDMRAEIENVVDEIKQAISLLRRHL
jgi:hypothetical protein